MLWFSRMDIIGDALDGATLPRNQLEDAQPLQLLRIPGEVARESAMMSPSIPG
jgi:hypothetical protein